VYNISACRRIYAPFKYEIFEIYSPSVYSQSLSTMPRGECSSGPRALAHLLAAHSIATPKQAKEPIRFQQRFLLFLDNLIRYVQSISFP
jgi:hypothetical protein